jgi:hypothetical protein
MKKIFAAWILVAGLMMPACGRSPLDDSSRPAGSGGATGVGTGVFPPSPGRFLCGAETCSTSSQQCCLGIDSGGGLSATCGSLTSTCNGAAFQCDEPADCRTGGTACCFGLDSPGASSSGLNLGSRCQPAASCVGPGRFILCATDADCGPKGGVCCAALGLPTCQPGCPLSS